MIPFPYHGGVALLLYALTALVMSGLLGGLALGKLNEERTGRLPRWLRLGLSGTLLVSALVHLTGGAWDTPAELYAALIFLGMLCGFVGDLIMSRLVRVSNRLVSGMVAFGLGHVLYSAAFGLLLMQLARGGSDFVPVLLLGLGGLVLWAWRRFIRRPGGNKALNVASLGYALLISMMVGLALNLAIQVRGLAALAVGALLFLVSDLVLGNWQVRGTSWTCVNDLIWTCYVLGQLLIVTSVAGAVVCLR